MRSGAAAFLARRALQAAAVVALVFTLTFVLLHAAPGDPSTALGANNPLITQVARDRIRAAYHLDDPLPVQYAAYVGRLLHGDLGNSIALHDSVAAVIGRALPNTLLLMGVATALSFLIGIGLGVLQGARRGTLVDRGTRLIGLVLYSTPQFWLALLALLFVAYKLGAFPIGGIAEVSMQDYFGPWDWFVDRAHHLVLPALTLTLANAAVVARFQRAALLDARDSDYVRTARAKGLGERGAIGRHALRNALLPTIALAGLSIPDVFGGAVFIERVFAWPGMGRLVYDAVGSRDYPVVIGGVIVAAVVVCLGSLLADAASAAADPRLRAR